MGVSGSKEAIGRLGWGVSLRPIAGEPRRHADPLGNLPAQRDLLPSVPEDDRPERDFRVARDPSPGGDSEAKKLHPDSVVGNLNHRRTLSPSQVRQTHSALPGSLFDNGCHYREPRRGRSRKMISVIINAGGVSVPPAPRLSTPP